MRSTGWDVRCWIICTNIHLSSYLEKQVASSRALDGVVKEMPEHERLFVLKDAKPRTGPGGGGNVWE